MIYFTTFIFTLLLAHAARAVPTCGNVTSPRDMYDSMYDDEQLVSTTLKATFDTTGKYDQRNTATSSTQCKNLAQPYQTFKDFPYFPFIGGASDIIQGPSQANCGKCWKLTNVKTHFSIFFTAIDAAAASTTGFEFVLSEHALLALSNERVVPYALDIKAEQTHPSHCGIFNR